MDQGRIRALGRALAAARGGGRIKLPDDAVPESREEAFAIQAETFAVHNAGIAGFKVGSMGPDAEVTAAPLENGTVMIGGDAVTVTDKRPLWIEAELAFRLGKDLPGRDGDYTVDEVKAAIATLHAGIEVVDPRFAAWPDVPPLAGLADLSANGRMIVSEGVPFPLDFNIDETEVRFAMGRVAKTVPGEGYPARDPFRLLAWLASNTGVWGPGGRARGLKAGDVIMTGSWIGFLPMEPDTTASVAIPGIGEVELRIKGA